MQDKRIQILSPAEIEAMYAYPRLRPEEQVLFFTVDEAFVDRLQTLKTTEVKISFILILGYFKAKSIFYKLDYQKSKHDILYIIDRFFPTAPFPKKYPSKSSLTKIKFLIKNYFKIDNHTQQKKEMVKKLRKLVQYNTIPTHLLQALRQNLYRENHPMPAYTTLQSLIGQTLIHEEKRLMHIIDQHMTLSMNQHIESLLLAKQGIYQISALKADPKSFKMHDIQTELKKHRSLHKIFNFAKKIRPKLQLSDVNINYYASLAIYYDTYRLQQFSKRKSQLYLICFIYNQFQKIDNNIIDAFIHYVRLYDKKSDESATKNIAQAKLKIYEQQEKIADILAFFENDKLNNYKFKSIKKWAFKKLPLEDMRHLKQFFKKGSLDKKAFIWQFHTENHRSTTTNLRPLFMEINFTCAQASDDLKHAVSFMKATFKTKKILAKCKPKLIPMQLIKDKMKKYFMVPTDKHNKPAQLDVYRYEYFVYQQLERGIRAGTTFSNHSVDYKSLTADLQLKEKSKDYKIFIQQSNLPLIKNDIKKTLNEKKEILETLIERVNRRIISGENKFVKVKTVKGKQKIIVPYEKVEGEFNDPFFDDHEQINIVDLLAFVDKLCDYSQAFSHLKAYQSKKTYDYEYLFACILANATGLGTHKIAESSHLNYDKLRHIEQSRIRLETLNEANKIICNDMAKLPFFKHQNINSKRHGSADGQKFDVRWETFKSRYLRKYFKEKGVSAYSMIVNSIAVDSMIITGHESHYLFDILFNNTTNIRPEILSTDTEGSNQVNFLLLDLIEVTFAPYYKSMGKKLKTICGFSDLKHYRDKGYVIVPTKKVKENLIMREWPNTLTLFAALLSGDTAQSTVVKKLSSHERHSDMKSALWEYNRILMSIYLLLCVDDPTFRRNNRKILNRGEGYHQIKRAIINVGGGDFRGKNEMEILVWNECARLVSNAIIYYNAYLLSNILEAKEKMGDHEAIALLKKISSIAWQHINLLGMYDFSLKGAIDIERVLTAMLKNFDEEWSKTKRKNA